MKTILTLIVFSLTFHFSYSQIDSTVQFTKAEVFLATEELYVGDTVSILLKRTLPDGSIIDCLPNQLFKINLTGDEDFKIVFPNGKTTRDTSGIVLPLRIYIDQGRHKIEAYTIDTLGVADNKKSNLINEVSPIQLTAPNSRLLSRMYQKSGYNKLRLFNYEGARNDFHKAISIDSTVKQSFLYDIACTYAVEGKSTEALNWLRKAFENGYGHVEHAFVNDSDLVSIRTIP